MDPDDLMEALLTGLDESDRSETASLIRSRADEERAAALAGHPERQVDVGTRPRSSRAATESTEVGSD